MGLDMYLTAKRDFWKLSEKNDKKIYKKIRNIFPELKETGNLDTTNIEVEVGYWRKANHIHKWFVDNVQQGKDDCEDYYVSREDLLSLKTQCNIVLNKRHKANEVLPTQGGFFFGGTDYDEHYFNDIKRTIEIIDYCLSLPKEWQFSYHSSW